MQMAQKLSGYTLGGADLLRRAMGKKKKEEMDKQQAQFVAGAVSNGVKAEQAADIFREIAGFAEYGFNKSHSAAYALITYQTAYFKAHYPTEFFAATLTADKDKIDKVVRTVNEARGWGVVVLPPDINASDLDFTVVYANPRGNGPQRGPGKLRDPYGPRIRFGLGALRGVGEAALETVFEARRAGGAFKDPFEFAARVDAKRLNKGVLESLVQAGAFDATLAPLGVSRARAYAAVDRILERSRSAARDRERGQGSLFGALAGGGGSEAVEVEYPRAEEWDRLELLRREKAALGCYVSGHPLSRYGAKLARVGATETRALGDAQQWAAVTVAGMVEGYSERLFKGGSGGKAAFFEIEDMTGRVAAKLRGDRIDTYAAILQGGEPVLAHGKVSFPMGRDDAEDGGDREATLMVDSVEPLSDAVLRATRGVVVRLDADKVGRDGLAALGRLLAASPGSCPVELVLALPDGAEATLLLEKLRVTPSDTLLGGVEKAFGAVAELA